MYVYHAEAALKLNKAWWASCNCPLQRAGVGAYSFSTATQILLDSKTAPALKMAVLFQVHFKLSDSDHFNLVCRAAIW